MLKNEGEAALSKGMHETKICTGECKTQPTLDPGLITC